jgi:hypothetical protein
MKMTLKDKQKARARNHAEKQSGWEAKLNRNGSCEKMNFKFLVKLRR